MAIANVELTNTFDFWRIVSNQTATRVNSISTSNGVINAVSATITDTLDGTRLNLNHTGAAAVTNEISISFNLNDDVGLDEFVRLTGKSINPVNSDEVGEFTMQVSSAGAIGPGLRISSNGVMTIINSPVYETLITNDDDVPNKVYVDTGDTTVQSDALAFAIALG